MKKHLLVGVSALTGILFLAPGCGETAKNSEAPVAEKQEQISVEAPKTTPQNVAGQEILMSINGKPVIYEADLHQYKNDIIDAQPEQGREQYRQLIEVIPGAMRNIFDSQVNEELINIWIKKSGIDQSDAFKKEEQENLERFKKINNRTLKIKKFQESNPVTISAADVKKYYDENKDKIAELTISAAGVVAKGVSFDTEEGAKAFFNAVKNNINDFEKIAESKKLTIKDFGTVSEKSYEVEGPLRTKIITIPKFPTIEFIKVGDNAFVVVKATSKEEAKYVPLEQVKQGIEDMLKQQKSTEGLMKKLEELKKEYKIEVNEDYFARQAKSSNPNAAIPGGAPARKDVQHQEE